MNVYARKEYGNNIWAETLQDAVKYKGLFFPFSKNLKKRTGKSTPELYDETMEDLGEYYQKGEGVGLRSQDAQM